jgi:hypothetical protein
MEKYITLEINGGIGKSILASAVCSVINSTYSDRKLLVVTAYPEVFLNNPTVYRVFKMGNTPYFFEDYVKDKDNIFVCAEPYKSNGYINQSEHIIESWCKCNDLKYNGELPSLHITPRENQIIRANFKRSKPIMVFQPFGGAIEQPMKYSWNRDIPPQQADRIVDCLSDKYHIIQPIHNKQIRVRGAEPVIINFRELMVLVSLANEIIGIDSCIQHIAAAFKKSATVCWITNKPKVFGYDMHRNIFPSAKLVDGIHSIDGYFHQYDFSGNRLYDYPFSTEDVFSVTEIVEKYL